MNRLMRAAVVSLIGGWMAQAATITFASEGTAIDADEFNAFGATLVITPNPGWVAALPGSWWVSYANTGNMFTPGFTYTPNGTVVSFFDTVALPETPTFAWITYRADDSAAFYINNVLVQPEAPQAGNTYQVCSDFAVGCTVQTELTLNITPFLTAGQNVLRFDVAQRAGYSLGLNYAGTVDYLVSDEPEPVVPEPGTLLLIGSALIVVGLLRRNAR